MNEQDIAIAFRALANKWYAEADAKEKGQYCDPYEAIEAGILRSCANDVYGQVRLVIGDEFD